MAAGNGNGQEKLNLTIGGKSIGLQTTNLVTILLVMLLAVGGYLLWTSTDRRIATLITQHDQVLHLLSTQTPAILNALHDQTNTIVKGTHEQTLTFTQAWADQRTNVIEQVRLVQAGQREQTETVLRALGVLQWNLGQSPDQRIPLYMPVPEAGPAVRPPGR